MTKKMTDDLVSDKVTSHGSLIKYTVEVSLPMEGRKENIVNLVTSQITEGELERKPVRLLS